MVFIDDKPLITKEWQILMSWKAGHGSLGIGALGGPNDPFFGHLWLDGVMEPLDMVWVWVLESDGS